MSCASIAHGVYISYMGKHTGCTDDVVVLEVGRDETAPMTFSGVAAPEV